ncbi:MAG: nicotinate (nicotinamide) nucleotide adenylyltransferase [Bacteroides sp.]
MDIALFFGTFDPLHVGHVAIMGHLLNTGWVEELWLVPSPHNPLKEFTSITPYHERVAALRESLAYYADKRLRISEIEDDLPRPSYTIRTLTSLESLFPEHRFGLLIGGDSLVSLPRWYRGEEILARYPIWVYPRGAVQEIPQPWQEQGNIRLLEAPLLDISSTYIREGRRQGKNMIFFEAARCRTEG